MLKPAVIMPIRSTSSSAIKKFRHSPLRMFYPRSRVIRRYSTRQGMPRCGRKIGCLSASGKPAGSDRPVTKRVDQYMKIRQGYDKQGLNVPPLDNQTAKAMEIISKAPVGVDATPAKMAEVNQQLKTSVSRIHTMRLVK